MAGPDGSYRILSYNVRAFFDRYTERKPLLHATVRAVGPDVVGLQESMVNGAGLDTDMAAALRGGSADEWTALQDCATATHVAVCGTPSAVYSRVAPPAARLSPAASRARSGRRRGSSMVGCPQAWTGGESQV